jgi:peptidoglycan hydrolase-like protein with peptidoglycan-binding domain
VPNYRTRASAAVMDERMSDIERSSVGAIVMRSGGVWLRGAMALAAIFGRRPLDSIGILAATAAIGAVVVNALFLQVAPHPAPILAVKPRPVATSEINSTLPAAPPVARREDVAAAKPDVPAATRTRAQIVFDIQRELSRRGFFDEPVDGVYGPKTDAAIRDFEQAAGIKGSSQPDDALLRLITRSTAHAAPTVTAAVPTPTRAPPPARTAPTQTRTTAAAAPAATPAPTRTAAPTPVPPPAPVRTATPAPAPAPARVATPESEAVPRPPAPIRTGSISTAPSKRIISVQRALADFGYGQVAPTGVIGAETKSAIERFERERKLPVTGQVSDRLVRELAAVTGRPLE